MFKIKKVVLLTMICISILCFGCSNLKDALKKPDIVCSAESILDDISTLDDKVCFDKYIGKKVNVFGKINSIGYNEEGRLIVVLAYKYGVHHSWGVIAVFDGLEEERKIKKLQTSDWIKVEGKSLFDIVNPTGIRRVTVYEAKLIEAKSLK